MRPSPARQAAVTAALRLLDEAGVEVALVPKVSGGICARSRRASWHRVVFTRQASAG
jgi:hypothetical protein